MTLTIPEKIALGDDIIGRRQFIYALVPYGRDVCSTRSPPCLGAPDTIICELPI